jgi:fluoroquinolone transport system permease protein
MTGLFALVGHDLRLQYRYGIYAAYGFVIAFYVVALVAGRGVLPDAAIAGLIYSDPAAVGFFFLGALMMLEKAEGVRAALAASPAEAAQYFAGKATTLAGLSLVACLVLTLVHGAVPHPLLLLAAVGMTSLAFVGIGVPIALRFRTVSGYLVGAGALLTPIILPAGLALFEPMPVWLALWPPVAQYRLMLVALGYAPVDALELAVSIASSAAGMVGGIALALAALRRELNK